MIYMPGYSEDAIAQHGILQPGIAFLNKPFTSQALGEKIREMLDRMGVSPSASELVTWSAL